jgi:hypothetical protein
MNSLARSEQQNAATPVSTAFLLEHGYVHEGEFDRLARGPNLTFQSGLPLAWDGDAPRQTPLPVLR